MTSIFLKYYQSIEFKNIFQAQKGIQSLWQVREFSFFLLKYVLKMLGHQLVNPQ